MVGAGIGAAAGGVGAVPGAIKGGLTGLSAVAQAGFMNDMMRQEGAQTFLSLVDMGVPEDTARVIALAAGGAKGMLEYIGLREVGKVFPGAEKFLTREAATAALNAIKKNPSIAAALGDAGLAALRGIAGETGTEVLQEGVDIVAEDVGRRLAGVNQAAPTVGEVASRLADTAIQTIESTALVAGAGGAVRGARHYAVANQRENLLSRIQEAQSKTLDTVAQAVQESPVMKDMAGTGEALMQHLADEGVTPETIYIKPEAVQQIFFQDENPDLMAAAAEMGITPESLQENLALGTDVAVDFAKATTHILKDPERYAALKQDMRLEPSMMTDAEVEELSAMSQDADARLAYLDNLLAPLTEEVAAAQSRYDQRMEIAAPYVEQLRQAGYSENQANAYGLVLAANAERMAEVFGMTPQEYMQERMAGYFSMTQEEFERLASGGLEGMFENRETAAILQEMGITKGMSRSRKRRQLQPEFDYVYGHVDANSVSKLFGKDRVKELRREFGPGFFAKKGEGIGIDVLAQQFYDDERGMYDMNRTDVDLDDFMERVFMPHEEFEAGLIGQMRQGMLYQYGEKESTNSFGVPLSRVTRIEGNVSPAEVEAALLELAGQDLPNDIEGITAQVNSNQRRKLNSKKAASKTIDKGFTRSEHRGIAAKIADAWRWAAEAQRGEDKKGGQPDLTMRRFVSALNVNGKDAFAWITVKDGKMGPHIYSVELMQKNKLQEKVNGAGADAPRFEVARSFDEIIDRLNKPVNGNVLYQTAYHGTPHRFDKFTLDHIGEGEGAQVHGWGLYFTATKEIGDKRYRERLLNRKRSDYIITENGNPVSSDVHSIITNQLGGAVLFDAATENKKDSFRNAVRRHIDYLKNDTLNKNIIDVLSNTIERIDANPKMSITKFLSEVPTEETKYRLETLVTGARALAKSEGRRATIADVRQMCVQQRAPFLKQQEANLSDAAALEKLDIDSLDIKENEGQLFAVDIPENDVLLDEQKSFSEQPEKVRKALEEMGFSEKSPEERQRIQDEKTRLEKEISRLVENENADSSDPRIVELDKQYKALKPDYIIDGKMTGRDIYQAISKTLGSARAASLALNDAGVKGISYYGLTDGRCFVIFDDQAIDILNTFYQNPSLYSGGQRRARGAMSRLQDGRAVVGLFKSKNASTVLHETAHFWLDELREATLLDTAPEWVKDAWGKLQKAYGFEGSLNGLEDVERWTEVQERFARDFEAYAREGKAPSWELQTAFNRFRNWLTDIYRSVKSLLGMNELSEDVRQVFDTLLATQEEIEQSQRAVAGDSVIDLLGDEVAPELRDKYARASQRAYENASAAIANRRLVDRRAAEKEIRQQVTEEIDGSDTYKMIGSLREDGLDFDTLKEAISEDVAYRLREKWRAVRGEGKALIRKGGTLDLLDVAAQFDQDSVQGLAGALLDTPTRREAIASEVEQRLAQWDAQYDAEVEYSNAMDEALAVELEALTGQRQISPAQLRRQMDERTGVKKISAVDAEYKALKARLQSDERAARKAWNAAKREAGADAREKMAAIKEQERLRRAALGAAYRARIERDDIIRQLRKIGNSKSVPYDYMCQVRRLLQRWDGLGTEGQRLDPATLRKLPSLQEFLAQKSADSLFDEPITTPDWLMEDQAGRFSDLSIEQMRDVKRLIQELAHAGRNEGRMLADKEKREIKAVADECAAAAGQLSRRDYISDRAGVLDTIKGALRKGLSQLTSVRFLARALDGFNDHGVNHDAWLMPLQQARTDELTLQREMEEKLRAALTPLLKVGSLQKAFSIDSVPLMQDVDRQWAGMWDMDKVYSVALNMGNEGNLKALMSGYGWSEENLQAITSRLTAEEWQAVQAVWDTIDVLYPRLNEVYQTLKGVPLPKVKNQAFTVQTADGQVVRLKGGYYPLIFDQRLSDKAAENQSVDELLNGMEAVLRSPNPKSGFTKERKGGTLPPKLSLTVLDRHVTDTVHYITHALPLRDTMRLFRESSFKEAFIRAAGQENYDQLLPWLRGIARPGGEQSQGVVKAIDWLARRGSLYALGMNMKSAFLQLTSIGNSWSEVGFGNFLRASATMLSAPHESWSTVREKSAYMQNRSRLLDDTLRREYEEMQGRGVRGLRFGGRRFSLDMVRQAQMSLMIGMDAAVAYPTWLAAYDKAIARGAEEARAVAEADGAVVAAQGGGGPLDTPAVMRQAGLIRALCPFMSFALSDFNRKMETVRGFAEWAKTGHSTVTPGRLFRDFALQWVTPVALTVFMVSFGRDGEPPEGEEFLWEALTFYTMGIPIARDVSKMAENEWGKEGYKGGRTPLMLAGLDNAVRGLGHTYKAWNEGSSDAEYRAMKEMLNAVGFSLGIGTPQIWRTLEGSEAYWVDDEGGPLAPLLGKPQK